MKLVKKDCGIHSGLTAGKCSKCEHHSNLRAELADKGVRPQDSQWIAEPPDCFDLRGWVVDTLPQYADATRYMNPSNQYAADLEQWTLAGKPFIEREQAHG